MTATTSSERDPIAIVGIGCRLPGASGPRQLWQLLINGGEAIREIPSDRFDVNGLFDPTPATPGRIMSRYSGVVDGFESFDAPFFGIAPREAELLDPQQRLLLEVAWEAIEDAGIPADRLANTNTGIFIGLFLNDYESRMTRDQEKIDFYMTLGTARYSASGRLSYFLNLRGPSVTLDTACSSSLVAVHMACRSLWSGECDAALAGGANTILEPFITIAYSQSKMMAPDGKCKFGDASGNGYVRSDGAALVALKRLSDAQAAGDPIYAVILGGAVNNDGRGSGFLATPAQDGQEDLLRKAYRDAAVLPGRAQYVEAHGTGTLAGDPVEIGALGAVLGEGRRAGSICRIGSVKTNIGHTEGAAGVSGLIKVALALKHGIIPKSLHFNNPNPRIPWSSLPVAIQTEATPWPDGREGAIAGVSAFGISGTNAHVVLRAHTDKPAETTTASSQGDRWRVLPLSAATPDALADTARTWASFLRDEEACTSTFRDLCYTAAIRRTHHDHRLAVVARTRAEAADQLDAFIRGEAVRGVTSGHAVGGARPLVAFVFPGQGSQWLGMARGLLQHEPAFAKELTACDAVVREVAGWSVLETVAAGDPAQLAQINIVQPVLFSVEVALAALWRSWGVEPDVVVGHSMGEVAAAYVAGILSLEDAARIICRRSALLRRTSGQGGMAVVELSFEAARAALAGREDRLSVAVSNSPRSTVISGDPIALDELIATLEAREVFCRRVNVDVASHSPQMDPLRPDLLAALEGLAPRAGSVPFHSTVDGRVLDGKEANPVYWARNLREPVLFSRTVQELVASGHHIFIEMSPHPLLVGAINESAAGAADVLALSSLRRDEDEPSTILASLAMLHAGGGAVSWERLFEDGGMCVPGPSYPWQRERFWFDAPATSSGRHANQADLLGDAFKSASQPHVAHWEFDISLKRLPSLGDHRVRGAAVVPGAFFAELALQAAARSLGDGPLALDKVVLSSALVLAEEGAHTVQVIVSNDAPGAASFRILSRKANAESADGWSEHMTGTARSVPADARESSGLGDSEAQRARARARSTRSFSGPAHYAQMNGRGLGYGAAYQRVEEGWVGDRFALARLTRPDSGTGGARILQARAALLDGCFQVLGAVLPGAEGGNGQADTYVPTAIESLRVYARPDSETLWCSVTARSSVAQDADTFDADLEVTDAAGRVLMEARGLRLFRLERERDAKLRAAFHLTNWVAVPNNEAQHEPGVCLVLVGTSRDGSSVAERIAATGARVVTACEGSAFERTDDRFTVRAGESADIAAILQTVPEIRSVIDASTLGETNPTDSRGVSTAIAVAQALGAATGVAPRLWLMTKGAQSVHSSEAVPCLAGSALWGLRSVIAAEHPNLRCSAVDISDTSAEALDALCAELLADGPEDQVALRASARYVRRLRQGAPEPAAAAPTAPAGGRPYRVVTSSPGILDALALEELTRRDPADNEIEIEVAAAGLNFMNVMSALGACPGYKQGLGPLGIECAGRVARVGRGVVRFSPGDEVMAFAYDSMATHVIAHEQLAVRVPNGVTLTQAAGIPIAFLTADYALHHLARLSKGDRVLIHSAAGGVGMAALQLARAVGAEVFATAGTEDKRAWLRSQGVRYAGDSRSVAFEDEIRALTNGEGIDVVLNSLAGDAIRAGLSLLRAGGRFLELGKRDIYDDRAIGLRAFRQNISYFAIDLDALGRLRPAAVGDFLAECMARFEAYRLKPLPTEVFPAADVADAFRRMAQGGHTGKIVVAIDRETAPVRPRPAALPQYWGNGTYLITGGTGGLGLAVARWMVAQGARDLVLMSRGGAPPEAAALLDSMRAAGATVVVARGDVAREEDVATVLEDIARRGATLRGVVHSAGVLADATLPQLDREKILRTWAPKVDGAWHLHRLTSEQPLDFFVLFSSVAAFIGSAGQGNYAAANAWVDALAAHRRAEGRPAISINWAPWSEVGLAAAQGNRGDRLSERGLQSISPDLGVEAFGQLLHLNPVQAAVMPFSFDTWCEFYPWARQWPLFADLPRAGASATRPTAAAALLRDELLAIPVPRQRLAHLEQFLRQQVASVLKLAAARVDMNKPLRTLGLDSLMGLELRNRLEAACRISIPATLIWNYPTVGQLAPQLATRMDVPMTDGNLVGAAPGVPASAEERQLEEILAAIESLPDEAVDPVAEETQ